jgi:hypothetical protein
VLQQKLEPEKALMAENLEKNHGINQSFDQSFEPL